MIKEIKGNLIELAFKGEFDVIGHGCNCHNQMGAGIAVAVREYCKAAYMKDQLSIPGDKSKIGTVTYAIIENQKNPFTDENNPFVCVNCYTQYNYSRHERMADYDAIRSCMKKLKELFPGAKFGLPLIGAGLAGGDWYIIRNIIDEELGDEDVTIVYFTDELYNEFVSND